MPAHPLDPLSEDEFRSTAAILSRDRGVAQEWRYASIELAEPAKSAVRAWASGDPVPRRSLSVVWEKATNHTYEAVVDLVADSVVSWTHVPGVCPNFTVDEYHDVDHALHEHAEVLAALAARGISDPSLVLFDVWTYGRQVMPEQWRDRRLGWCDIWVRATPTGNPYAHPVSGLKIIVDMNTLEVLDIEDHHDYGFPDVAGEYDPRLSGITPRTDLKPLEITQPEGTSFEVDGHEVRWQKWRFRIGFTPREGLVLYTVSYNDNGRERPILYRAALSEMVVPYGDPRPAQWRKNAFDAGEYNIGALANSLELGCDCLGEIHYFDGVVSDGKGNPLTIKNAVCMHEEDYGLLWKHFDMRSKETEVRRSRRLVISFVATVANYEYGFFWYLYQDGTIEFEGKLSGIVSTGALPPGENTRHGQLLNDEGLYGPIHQHFLNFRLDMDVDGQENSVYEVNTESVPPGEENPHGNAYYAKATQLETEADGGRNVNMQSVRYWRIVNESSQNRLGDSVAYKLVPKTNVLPFAQEDAQVSKRGGFASKHFWVTPYEPSERHAGGAYPNQSPGDDGLVRWVQQNRSVKDEDVVIWYTLGAHHPVRLEDWPVMPVEYAGFVLKPEGFFDRNPALDVPRPGKNGHCS
jgi:primary-amine oxidase